MMKPMNNEHQDKVLDKALNEKAPATVILKTGVQLKGKIEGHDRFCLVLNSFGKQQLIYKHAVSTIIS
jgi:host factor-I protein